MRVSGREHTLETHGAVTTFVTLTPLLRASKVVFLLRRDTGTRPKKVEVSILLTLFTE